MKILKGSKSEGKRVIKIYESLRGRTLYDLYKNPSSNIISVYEDLHNEFDDDVQLNLGHSFRCTYRAGSWSWSCGWQMVYNGHQAIKVHTRDNVYIVDLEQ